MLSCPQQLKLSESFANECKFLSLLNIFSINILLVKKVFLFVNPKQHLQSQNYFTRMNVNLEHA